MNQRENLYPYNYRSTEQRNNLIDSHIRAYAKLMRLSARLQQLSRTDDPIILALVDTALNSTERSLSVLVDDLQNSIDLIMQTLTGQEKTDVR